jgi:gluconate 2-dehydrogenase gamma chain
MSDDQTPPMDRREALKVIAASAAAASLAEAVSPMVADAQQPVAPSPRPRSRALPTAPPTTGPRGTRTDPDLIKPVVNWPKLLSAAELVTLSALCDMIIPSDDKSPSASSVGVPRYINEYVSAPYDWAERALVRVRGGLTWLNTESGRRFGGRTFSVLTAAEKVQICDDICFYPNAKPEYKAGARFFGEIRNLTQSGFYTSDAGMKDLQYIGNVPLARFDGPSPAVLRHLGLA